MQNNHNNHNLPRITIVTPSYNQGEFLEETIKSVINQNYPNLEYFVIDGGSTDHSVEIIEKYQKEIDWWVSEKDEGQSDAICKGFDRATGDLLSWLNSDDVYFPGALLKIGQAYARLPGASIYVGGIAVGKTGNRGIKKCSIPTPPHAMFSSYGILGFGQQSSFFSSQVYRQTGGLDRNLYLRMDGDVMYRLMKCHSNAVVIEDMIGFFRWHENTKSTKSVDRYLRERNDFIRSLGISALDLRARKTLFRIYRLVSGGYFKSWRATFRFKGLRMSEIWATENLLG